MMQRSEPVRGRRAVVSDVYERTARSVNRERVLVERLLARRKRRETQSVAAAMPGPASIPQQAGSLPPPAALVAHGRFAAKPELAPTPLRGFAPSVADAGTPPRSPLAAVDVQVLADQVIRTIDQRVIAARERLGTR